MRTTIIDGKTCDQEKVKQTRRMYELCGTWKNCAEAFISSFAKRSGLSSLTKFHASNTTGKIEQAHQGRIMSFHTPFMSMKGRTLG